MKKINIAIDGYSSCGKGTIARYLAKELHYRFVDSGAMYRAVTLFALQNALDVDHPQMLVSNLHSLQIDFVWTDTTGIYEVCLNGKNVEAEIRSMAVAEKVSQVARIPEVRKYLVALQRQIAAQKGVVMDGRDIGTVVMPEAELKIFMTAKPEVRARRRFAELKSAGIKTTYEDVLHNLISRDKIDSSRSDSPLTLTSAYKVLDNSELSREAQNEIALGWVKEVIGT